MDRHTLLANKVFCLCSNRKSVSWPLVLFNLGYYVHSVEKLVRVGSVNVSPDIILASKTHDHALVVECKSGANVDVEQDASYSRMSMGDLWKSGVPMTTRRHTPVYAINENMFPE